MIKLEQLHNNEPIVSIPIANFLNTNARETSRSSESGFWSS